MLRAAKIPLYIIAAMVFIFAFSVITDANLAPLGILPRTSEGFLGIFTAYFIHGSIEHLLSNIFSFLFLGTALFWFYPNTAPRVLGYGWLFTGFLVWIVARPSVHIGASGLVYVMASFLIFSGFFRKEYGAIVISMAVFLLHSGMIVGIFPQENHVSWESHAVGFFLGIVFAYIYRNEKDFEEPSENNHKETYFPYQKGWQNWRGKDYHYTFKKNEKAK